MFEALGRLVHRRRRWVLALTGVFVLVAVVWGSGVFGALSNGGYDAPGGESTAAVDRIESTLGRSGVDLVVLYDDPGRTVDSPAYRTSVESALAKLPPGSVTGTRSYWTTRSPMFVSADRHSTYVALTLAGATPEDRLDRYHDLEPVLRDVPGLEVRIGGGIALYQEINEQTREDVERAELISLPIVLVLLVVVFGGLVAAGLPLIVGGLAILGAFTVLRLLALVTDVSVFSINVVTMIGLGLAIDYALFIVTRFREQLAAGDDVERAVVTTMATAGRTVAFSGVTVGIAMASLAFIPLMFLRSMAYGGVAVVAVAMVAALTALPALLSVLGHRVDRLRLPFGARREREHGAWYRLAHSVMRRPVLYVAVLVPLLLVLGLPFLRAQLGGVDHRVLPASSEARVVTDMLPREFPGGGGSDVLVAVEYEDQAGLDGCLSRVRAVDGVQGVRVAGSKDGFASVLVHTPYASQDLAARDLVRALRDVPDPPGTTTLVGGEAAATLDSLDAMLDRLPLMIGFVVLMTCVLLFVAFGSVVLPVKAVLMNVLSLSASFGALIWVFQDGHLSGPLQFTPTGFLDYTLPVLMFAVLFGLSMDYEVFLLSRIREEYDRTGDNVRAVATGLQRTGRIITSAALLLVIVVGAFSTSGIVIVKAIGIGLVIAILLDATVVRALLVPATMRLLGRVNWWAPAPMARWWQRHGLREEAISEAPVRTPASRSR